MTNKKTTARQFVATLESGFLRALAEPARLEILKILLLGGPTDIGTLAGQLPQERSVVSRHVKVLVDAGIVVAHRAGRHQILQIDGQSLLSRFEAILEQVRSLASICCPAVLARKRR